MVQYGPFVMNKKKLNKLLRTITIARMDLRWPSTRDPNVSTRTKKGLEEFEKPDGELIKRDDAKTQRDAE